MQLYVGTSGYSYPEWKGKFYPEKLSTKKMLGYYAQHFTAVELNYTFRTLPAAKTIDGWLAETPKHFRFAPKASQSITHFKRLKAVEEPMDALLAAIAPLESRLGPLLVQLPPNFKKDLERLEDFLEMLRKRKPVAFEFRHPSWFEDDIYDCLRRHAAALCIADSDDLPMTEIISTTDWGYLRLRSSGYTDRQLKDWVKKIQAQAWREAWVFFKHEETGTGPDFAQRLMKFAMKK